MRRDDILADASRGAPPAYARGGSGRICSLPPLVMFGIRQGGRARGRPPALGWSIASPRARRLSRSAAAGLTRCATMLCYNAVLQFVPTMRSACSITFGWHRPSRPPSLCDAATRGYRAGSRGMCHPMISWPARTRHRASASMRARRPSLNMVAGIAHAYSATRSRERRGSGALVVEEISHDPALLK